MKKILAALLVLALIAPAMADVAITSAFDNVSKNLTISFNPTAGASVRGIAVTVTVTGGAVDAYVSSSFNTFVDYAFSNPTGYTVGAGNPVAKETQAGVLALPVASGTPFAVSVGYLDTAGHQAGLTAAGTVAVLHIGSIAPAGGTVAVVANAARGGAVVGDTIGAVTVTGTTIPTQVVSCRDRLPAADKLEYDKYIAARGASFDMSSWCNRFQCRGDFDNGTEGASWVIYSADLNGLVANWKAKVATANPAADFDHAAEGASWRVYSNDLSILVANWKKKAANLTNCPGYVAP
jgi:hypothetical protein